MKDKEIEMLEDAAEYWQEQFIQFYNKIHRIATKGSIEIDENALFEALETYSGQSDEQHRI